MPADAQVAPHGDGDATRPPPSGAPPVRAGTLLDGDRIRPAKNPTAGRVEAAVLAMARDSVVVLSRTDDADTYIQVWQRPDGLYQLEHRAGSPAEHYQTLTVSPEKVYTAFTAWLRGEEGWQRPFTWRSIAEQFTGDAGA